MLITINSICGVEAFNQGANQQVLTHSQHRDPDQIQAATWCCGLFLLLNRWHCVQCVPKIWISKGVVCNYRLLSEWEKKQKKTAEMWFNRWQYQEIKSSVRFYWYGCNNNEDLVLNLCQGKLAMQLDRWESEISHTTVLLSSSLTSFQSASTLRKTNQLPYGCNRNRKPLLQAAFEHRGKKSEKLKKRNQLRV